MNRRIRQLAIALLVCYSILFVQLNLLQVGRANDLNADFRNTRQTVRDFNRPRGPIVTADGVVVAQTVALQGEAAAASTYDYQRVYPTAGLFADITGYYTLTYGSTQVERTQNDILSGRDTRQQLQWITGLFRDEDLSGSVELTLRNDIQAVARSALAGREGSVVALDPRTGAVLAMYSNPTYDPNLVATHDTELAGQVLDFLNLVPGKPLLANAYQERYMPGSSFKVITTGIALEDGLISLDTEFEDQREWTPPQTSNPIRNYGGTVCGGDLPEVFRRSCNIPFAMMGLLLGPEKMVAGTKEWGIGEPVPIDLPRPASSYFGEVEDFVDSLPLLAMGSFGQGNTQMVPLHMAMVAATIANGGQMMAPYVVEATYDHDGGVLDRTSPEVWQTPISPGTAATLRDLMVGVVQNGTARCCMQLANGVQAAAKTGTAQLNAEGEPERSHAWIIAFAPAEAPRVAVAVMLKGVNAEISAGTGGTLAGPVARQVLDAALVAVPT